MLGKLDAKKVRAAAEQVFEERATRAFPPTVQIAAERKPALFVDLADESLGEIPFIPAFVGLDWGSLKKFHEVH